MPMALTRERTMKSIARWTRPSRFLASWSKSSRIRKRPCHCRECRYRTRSMESAGEGFLAR
ncbi:hypothetical protein [Streptosporangium amethystogenes]|uniref:hypothetical protein n=1 Tax=Streptosporangium amethystogenes TaxID=2002 RepID=UPI0012FA21F4|nr:hypothetical protein [Streptosporangium amethystogenes]